MDARRECAAKVSAEAISLNKAAKSRRAESPRLGGAKTPRGSTGQTAISRPISTTWSCGNFR